MPNKLPTSCASTLHFYRASYVCVLQREETTKVLSRKVSQAPANKLSNPPPPPRITNTPIHTHTEAFFLPSIVFSPGYICMKRIDLSRSRRWSLSEKRTRFPAGRTLGWIGINPRSREILKFPTFRAMCAVNRHARAKKRLRKNAAQNGRTCKTSCSPFLFSRRFLRGRSHFLVRKKKQNRMKRQNTKKRNASPFLSYQCRFIFVKIHTNDIILRDKRGARTLQAGQSALPMGGTEHRGTYTSP